MWASIVIVDRPRLKSHWRASGPVRLGRLVVAALRVFRCNRLRLVSGFASCRLLPNGMGCPSSVQSAGIGPRRLQIMRCTVVSHLLRRSC